MNLSSATILANVLAASICGCAPSAQQRAAIVQQVRIAENLDELRAAGPMGTQRGKCTLPLVPKIPFDEYIPRHTMGTCRLDDGYPVLVERRADGRVRVLARDVPVESLPALRAAVYAGTDGGIYVVDARGFMDPPGSRDVRIDRYAIRMSDDGTVAVGERFTPQAPSAARAVWGGPHVPVDDMGPSIELEDLPRHIGDWVVVKTDVVLWGEHPATACRLPPHPWGDREAVEQWNAALRPCPEGSPVVPSLAMKQSSNRILVYFGPFLVHVGRGEITEVVSLLGSLTTATVEGPKATR